MNFVYIFFLVIQSVSDWREGDVWMIALAKQIAEIQTSSVSWYIRASMMLYLSCVILRYCACMHVHA